MKLSDYFDGVIARRFEEFGMHVNDAYVGKIASGLGVLEKMLWLRFEKDDDAKRDAQVEKALKRYNDEIVEIAKQLTEKFDGDHDKMIRDFRIEYTNLYKDSKGYCHNVNGSKKVSVNIDNVREFLGMKGDVK